MSAFATLVALVLLPAVPLARQPTASTNARAPQPRDSTFCQSDIVSPTVVATTCDHREGADMMVDLLIVWSGAPGWFYKRSAGDNGNDLRCDIPMPPPPAGIRQVPVITVCQKPRAK